MKKITVFYLLFTVFSTFLFSQYTPLTLQLEQVTIPNAPRLHSFAFAQSNGKWLFIGGRNNGLHGFVLGYSFQPKYQNRYIWVVDPNTNQVWSMNMFNYLSIAKADPIRCMNMQFYQDGNKLYMAGGYGLDSLKDSLVTFPNLTVIDVDEVINAVINNVNIDQYIHQVTDERMRVCGAAMEKLGDYIYVPGGHNFWGDYTRTVNNQIYTNRIKKFKVTQSGMNYSITDYTETVDTVNYHRRDYNLVPAIRSNGNMGLTLYGGVFKYGVDLPYQNPIYIDDGGITVDAGFEQKMTQYTTANFTAYDSVNHIMSTTFLGGTSLYYYDNNSQQLIMDTLVPFIKSITTLSRESNGNSSEYVHPQSFPVLLGTNAIFILNQTVPHYSNGVIKLASLTGNTFIGYMYGGIKADFPNMGTSSASDRVYKISIAPNPFGIQPIGTTVPSQFSLEQNYPNPFNPQTTIIFNVAKKDFVNIILYDILGREVSRIVQQDVNPGRYSVQFDASRYSSGVYFYRMSTSTFSEIKKMVLTK